MRKHIIQPIAADLNPSQQDWLDLETLARVEFSSEAPEHPIDHAFKDDDKLYWQAGQPGEQTIRVIFDQPRAIHFIQLCFEEKQAERTQEYVLSYSQDGGKTTHELVRQQWNFSPTGSTQELAEHAVDLIDVKWVTLTITPDISGRAVCATLTTFKIA